MDFGDVFKLCWCNGLHLAFCEGSQDKMCETQQCCLLAPVDKRDERRLEIKMRRSHSAVYSVGSGHIFN